MLSWACSDEECGTGDGEHAVWKFLRYAVFGSVAALMGMVYVLKRYTVNRLSEPGRALSVMNKGFFWL
jgi:hypothetical protein